MVSVTGGKMTRMICALLQAALLSTLGLTSIARAQTSWWRTYGGTGGDGGRSVQQTSDSGYIIAGWTYSFGAGGEDVYLIRTDASGDTLWTRTYGGTSSDCGFSVQQTSDGGYVVAGNTMSFGAGDDDVYLIKTLAQGDTLWTRTRDGTSDDCGYSVQQTSDGGYIVAGATVYRVGGVFLIKTKATGDALWTRAHGRTLWDEGYSVRQTLDSGYIVAGGTGAGGDVYLIKTNAFGDTVWTRTYGGTLWDEGYSVRQTSDGGYIIAGLTYSFGAGYLDVYLIKTDASGDTVWTRTYGGTDNDVGYSVQQTSDGGHIIAGYTASFGAGHLDVYLIKTNASGDILWTRTYGGTNNDEGYSVQQTSDGGYIIAGYTYSFGAGNLDVYLIKTDSLGDVGVEEESPKPQIMSRKLAATVVRSLPECAVAFDAMGRRVLHPEPGIYFVKEPKAQAQAPAVQKVLLVR